MRTRPTPEDSLTRAERLDEPGPRERAGSRADSVVVSAPEAITFSGTADLLTRYLESKSNAATRRAYRFDLYDFFAGDLKPHAVSVFLAQSAPTLTRRLRTYKEELLARGASQATVNRRLSVVRSLLRFAHAEGLATCDGRGLVDGEKPQPGTPGPVVSQTTLRRLMAVPGTQSLRGLRDSAILRLLCENALRRSEVCALNASDFSLADQHLLLPGKAREPQPVSVPLSGPAARAIDAYLAAAGHSADGSQSLFRNLDHRPDVAGKRLTPDGLYHLVREYAREIGEPGLTPHQLRRGALAGAFEARGVRLERVLRLPSEKESLTTFVRTYGKSTRQREADLSSRPHSDIEYSVVRSPHGTVRRVLKRRRQESS